MKDQRKKLQKLVEIEAKALLKYATKTELKKLSFNIDPDHTKGCVYGKMTGHCYSERAAELILKCASKTCYGLCDPIIGTKPTKKKLDGFRRSNHSPIEAFIFQRYNQENGNNKILIKYLKGKTKKLEFN